MTIDIRIEKADELDARHTADLARAAFGKGGPELSAERFAWTYREGYPWATLVSAYSEGQKVGQLAGLYKTVALEGESHRAAELVDLFVAPAFRSFQGASNLYKELRRAATAEGAKLIYAYANDAASLLNKRFFKMEELTPLPARIGFSLGFTAGHGVTVLDDAAAIAALHAEFEAGGAPGGVAWSEEAFRRRISSPVFRYVCATDGDCAVLASPRLIRSVPILLICATFSRAGHRVRPGALDALLARLCRTTGRPLYLYVGWNDQIGFDRGFALPPRALGGKFIMQSNFLNSRRAQIGRFELLDVDYG